VDTVVTWVGEGKQRWVSTECFPLNGPLNVVGGPLLADSVDSVGRFAAQRVRGPLLAPRVSSTGHVYMAGASVGAGISLASLRRF
jgi:hypothetical protein